MADDLIEVVYQIDELDRLILFNYQWDFFAYANHGQHLVADQILGQSLWDFVSDIETRHIHQKLLENVRAGKNISGLPFRCDSPELRRHMEMDLVLLDDGVVEYRNRIIRMEQRSPVPFIAPYQQGSDDFLRMCSWCKKIEIEGDSWLELEEAIPRLGLFDSPNLPGITHGMCGACLEQQVADILV